MKWKQYKNYNYEVSEDGYVRNIITKKTITPVIKQNGYMEIRFNYKGKTKCMRLHKMVYLTWLGNIKDGYNINHINGIKTDNRVSNLEQVTQKENNDKRLFLRRGVDVNTSKLDKNQVMEIRKAKKDGVRTIDLVNKYNVTKTTILRIANGKTWKHLPVLTIDNSVWSNPKKTGYMSGKELSKKFGDDYFSNIAKGKKFYSYCEKCGKKLK